MNKSQDLEELNLIDTPVAADQIYKAHVTGLHEGIRYAIEVIKKHQHFMKACNYEPLLPNGENYIERLILELRQLIVKNWWLPDEK